MKGKYDDLRFAVSDKLHQNFRKENVPNFDEIMEKSYDLGAKATYLSGSGPTIVSLISEKYDEFEKGMKEFLDSLEGKWSIRICSIDNVGAILKECTDEN